MLFLDRFQFRAGIRNGFIPRNRFELTAAFAPDQRLRQAWSEQLGVVQEVPAVKAFQAQRTFIGDAVCALGTNDLVVLDQ